MCKKCFYWVFILTVLFLSKGTVAIGQQSDDKPHEQSKNALSVSSNSQNSNISHTSSVQGLDDQLRAQIQNAPETASTASKIEGMVIQRIQSGAFVSDESVMAVVNYRIILEQKQVQENKKKSAQFPMSKTLIKTLIAYTHKRPMLTAELFAKLSDVYAQEGNTVDKAKSSASAVVLLRQLDIQTNELRVQSLLSTADALYSLGDRPKADTLYVEVLSYPYEYILDPEADKIFVDCYRQAAVGLINSRQGNVTALEQIFLRPWARIELDPYLQQVIKQAKERTATTTHP